MPSHQKFNAEAQLAAKRAKEIGLTQTDISRALSASQSQVSRVLSGRSARRSKLLDRVCNYVFSITSSIQPDPQTNEELMSAVAAVWDGSSEHAQALALVIRSLGSLSRPATAHRRQTERKTTS
jgi:transcriptional regulator with XRE-family HTH domain